MFVNLAHTGRDIVINFAIIPVIFLRVLPSIPGVKLRHSMDTWMKWLSTSWLPVRKSHTMAWMNTTKLRLVIVLTWAGEMRDSIRRSSCLGYQVITYNSTIHEYWWGHMHESQSFCMCFRSTVQMHREQGPSWLRASGVCWEAWKLSHSCWYLMGLPSWSTRPRSWIFLASATGREKAKM